MHQGHHDLIAMSYDVLIGGAILCPMGCALNSWKEIVSYILGWKSKDGKSVHLLIYSIGRKLLNHVRTRWVPSLVTFFEIASFGGKPLENNVYS